jgi:hypothetical protein
LVTGSHRDVLPLQLPSLTHATQIPGGRRQNAPAVEPTQATPSSPHAEQWPSSHRRVPAGQVARLPSEQVIAQWPVLQVWPAIGQSRASRQVTQRWATVSHLGNPAVVQCASPRQATQVIENARSQYIGAGQSLWLAHPPAGAVSACASSLLFWKSR